MASIQQEKGSSMTYNLSHGVWFACTEYLYKIHYE